MGVFFQSFTKKYMISATLTLFALEVEYKDTFFIGHHEKTASISSYQANIWVFHSFCNLPYQVSVILCSFPIFSVWFFDFLTYFIIFEYFIFLTFWYSKMFHNILIISVHKNGNETFRQKSSGKNLNEIFANFNEKIMGNVNNAPKKGYAPPIWTWNKVILPPPNSPV